MLNVNNLTNPDIILKLYGKYYSKDQAPNRFISSYWKQHSAGIRVSIDDSGNFREFLAYGFGLVHKTHAINRLIHYISNMSYLLRLKRKEHIRDLWKKSAQVLKPLNSYMSSESFRQLYSLDTIMQYLKVRPDEKFTVMVIGDGHGFLSAMMKTVYPNCRIILVDLGKVLLFQSVNLQRIFPKASHRLVWGEGDYSGADFTYCPTENLEMMNNVHLRLIVNIASMQEMNQETIRRYFDYIRHHAVPDNLFYCCNRKFKTLPGGEITEIYKFPWDESDRHLVDEHCDFFRYYLSWRPPFVIYFDGPLYHRLTNMKLENRIQQETVAAK